MFFTGARIGAGRRCSAGAGRTASSARAAAGSITASSRPARSTSARLPTADLADRRHDLRRDQVPLRTWFRAIYHLTQSKGGISSLELGRRLGVTQTTAWKIKHKLMQAMMEREAANA